MLRVKKCQSLPKRFWLSLRHLAFLPGHAQVGDTVTLRTEQDLLMIAAAVPHPMDDTKVHGPAGVRVELALAAPPTVNDEPARFRPESGRALEQTRRAFA